MIAHYLEKLAWLDRLIDMNDHNPDAVASLLEQYREHAEALAKLRDESTIE